MEVFLGTILMVGFNFAPVGWALCEGQLLPIAQNAALFSLLGTTYGGDGRTTFALPDLRGRIPIGMGQGPGMPMYALGQSGTTPSTAVLAAGTHPVNPGEGYLGVNFIIALQGIFPSRS